VREAQRLGLKVIVWTVNESRDIERMIDFGVDGIISDYPDRLRRVAAARGLPLPAPTPVTP
jgi:glycerophosphoryl diester phosphodiesterase